MEELTCLECGTTYRGAAIERLAFEGSGFRERYYRDGDFIYRRVVCVCQTDHYGRAIARPSSMPKVVAGPDHVLADLGMTGECVGRVIRATASTVFVQMSLASVWRFATKDGRQIGGKARLVGVELERAVALGAAMRARPAKAGPK